MKIEYIKISNFRGINIEISDLEKSILIMGRNDTGKSNICYAIRKVLDPNVRRISFIESDSTNSNKEKILIELKIDFEGVSAIQRSKIGSLLDRDDTHEYLYIKYEAIFNYDLYFYEEKIIMNENDEKIFATNVPNYLDTIIDLIYIEPNYNYEKSMNNYFGYKKKDNEKNLLNISNEVLEQNKKMNEAIQNDEVVKDMTKEINDNVEFKYIFDNVTFDITSNFDMSNIYKSLDIQFIDENGHNIGNMGDGKIKTLSMLLKKASYSKDKIKFMIIEEPENHMYPLLQKSYAKIIDGLDIDQCIFTSHSPYIFDLKK